MGQCHVKFDAVEQTYESIHLNQYLDLYETICASIGRKKRFTVTDDHIHILSILDETIYDLLERIEYHVGTFYCTPYQKRFTSIHETLHNQIIKHYFKETLYTHTPQSTKWVNNILRNRANPLPIVSQTYTIDN